MRTYDTSAAEQKLEELRAKIRRLLQEEARLVKSIENIKQRGKVAAERRVTE